MKARAGLSGGSKALAILMCLLFALPFSGVALFAIGYMGTVAWKVIDARDWVRVKAETRSKNGPVAYRYSIGGKYYDGKQLTFGAINEGDYLTGDAEDRFNAAANEGKPFSVFVNPRNPSESVIEPGMPWMLLAFFTPFMVGFGAVGFGAFWVLSKVLRGQADEKPAPVTGPRKSEAGSGIVHAWVFAVLWNCVAIPIALLAVPQMLASKEYLGLFVLIFPLIGVFVLWAAISATYLYLRRGGAMMHLNPENPRVGSAVQGFIAFPRGVEAGESFKVKLLCQGVTDDGDGGSKKEERWAREQTLRTTQAPNGVRLPFRIEVPVDACRPKARDQREGCEYKWRLEAMPEARRAVPYAFALDVRPPPEGAFDAAPSPGVDDDELQLAGLGPHGARLEQLARDRGLTLSGAMRDRVAELTPDQREAVVKVLRNGSKIKKIVIWIVVAVVGFQVLSFIVAIVAAVKFSP